MNPFVVALTQGSGKWLPVADVGPTVANYITPPEGSTRAFKAMCAACDTEWLAPKDEPVVCWLCGTGDAAMLWTFSGRPWAYDMAPEKHK